MYRTKYTDICVIIQKGSFEILIVFSRDVVSGVFAMATWLGGWLGVCPSVTAGIVSKRLNLS